LDLFEEKGIIEKLTLNNGVFSYKLKGKTHQHHLECNICHKEVEIPCPILQIQEIVQNLTGFTLTTHDLVMKGICKDCKKKQ
jgi:Fe2+ or Zn2+ uptake regulation protein